MSDKRPDPTARIKLLTKHDVADALGMQASTVTSWARTRRYLFAQPIRMPGSAEYRWYALDVERWLDHQRRNPPPARTSRGGALLRGRPKRERAKLLKPSTGQERTGTGEDRP